LIGFAATLLVATLFTTWLRWLALAPLAAAVAMAMSSHQADIFIDREASGLAARTASGPMAVVGSPSAFVVQQWLRAAGDSRRADDPGLRSVAACDEGGCVVIVPGGRAIAWSRDPLTIAEDCKRADLVVTPLRWDGACNALMVDRRTLDRYGAISVRSTPTGLVASTGRNPDAPRPWSRREAIPISQRTPAALNVPAADPVSSGEPD
jgi:competence protein ComEC